MPGQVVLGEAFHFLHELIQRSQRYIFTCLRFHFNRDETFQRIQEMTFAHDFDLFFVGVKDQVEEDAGHLLFDQKAV